MKRALFLLLASSLFACAAQKLLVVSVDGLDQRYLEDRDRLGLRIPHIRRLLAEGQWAKGVLGVVPTVTWPSHITLITGVTPAVHGIRGNRRPAAEGGDYPWSASLLKARTLFDAAHETGLKTAAITWPVTVDAPVDFNLPEYFQRRRGGAMDMHSIASKATPRDLAQRIARMFPSFPQEWMDDRTRTQAVVYLLKTEQPNLLAVHLVDLDSEEHDNGPFSPEANAILEYTDELIGQMLAALPSGYAVALVSDHGFERTETVVNLKLAAASHQKDISASSGVALAQTSEAADALRALAKDPKYGIGREIAKAEVVRFAPDLAKAVAVFEPAPGFQLTAAGGSGEIFTKPHELGNHGHWPTRYRAVYVFWGTSGNGTRVPEIAMTDIAGQLASVIGVKFSPGGKP